MDIKKKPTMLMILDGFGIAPPGDGNAIYLADTPNLDGIFAKYPKTSLKCGGSAVGLPDGQMGNSEVGHLNIGAGRIIYQDLSLIYKAIDDGTFFENPELNKAMDHCVKNSSTLHLLGLLSDGGVHSHIDHLLALVDMAKEKGVGKLAVHCFLDGRDVPPTSGIGYVEQLQAHLEKTGLGEISVISGRYYAMDRDKRWERVRKAYDAMTLGTGPSGADSPAALVERSYADDVTDEFVVPVHIEGAPLVDDGDAMIMYNFRPDRAREITRAFVDPDFDGFEREKTVDDLCYICMSQYDATLPNVEVAFKPETYNNTLGEYASDLGLRQLRIAETEKYAHVTFFFNGGVEEPNPNEDRILIPSPKVATYDLQPEMSAYLVTEELLKQIDSDKYDLIIINFANCDMVGHTGVLEAAVKAVEAIDECVGRITEKMLEKDGQFLLTADHGNADEMIDAEGKPMTAHSLNDVPLALISNEPSELSDGGKLCDLAPTLLEMMEIEIPVEMEGHSLLK
jgi:2,3-bisphosphoglycerate-independent phosphoglycerate mutase